MLVIIFSTYYNFSLLEFWMKMRTQAENLYLKRKHFLQCLVKLEKFRRHYLLTFSLVDKPVLWQNVLNKIVVLIAKFLYIKKMYTDLTFLNNLCINLTSK